MPSGVKVWVVPTRLFGETELSKAADARIATILGGSFLKVSELHFAVCHRRIDIHQRAVSNFIHDFSRYLGLIFVIEAISCVANSSCTTEFLDVVFPVLEAYFK